MSIDELEPISALGDRKVTCIGCDFGIDYRETVERAPPPTYANYMPRYFCMLATNAGVRLARLAPRYLAARSHIMSLVIDYHHRCVSHDDTVPVSRLIINDASCHRLERLSAMWGPAPMVVKRHLHQGHTEGCQTRRGTTEA